MPKLFDPIQLRGKTAPNRLVLPPMLTMAHEINGMATETHCRHYAQRAADGIGLVIVECTAISPHGRNSPGELGLYSQGHIAPMARLAQGIKEHGALALVQLHHSGRSTPAEICRQPFAPSGEVLPDGRIVQAMNPAQIHHTINAFAAAALRAMEAGFDGVELHGCHGYLLNQFASPTANRRTDAYGGRSPHERLTFAREVIAAIRNATHNDFIIGYRMGFNDPDQNSGLAIAQSLAHVVDYLHISSGIGPGLICPPKGYPYNWFVRAAQLVRQHVSVPVIAVNGLHTLKAAQSVVLDGYADMAAVGRPYLLNADWLSAQKEKRPILRCLKCSRGCRYLKGACPFIRPSFA